MKWILYRVVSSCLNKENDQNREVEKSLLLRKIVIKNVIGFDCICLYQDTFFKTYHPSYTQIGHLMGRGTVYCNFNRNMVEGVGCPVLAALASLLKGRLFHAPTRTTSSGCFMLHRTIHALWNLYGNPYRNRAVKEEETVTWWGNS